MQGQRIGDIHVGNDTMVGYTNSFDLWMPSMYTRHIQYDRLQLEAKVCQTEVFEWTTHSSMIDDSYFSMYIAQEWLYCCLYTNLLWYTKKNPETP